MNLIQKTIISTAKSLQSCPTLCDPIDGSPPGSPIPGILQARTLGWVAISFSNVWKWKVKVKSLSCVWLFVTPWTAAHQAPPSMGFFQARVLEWGAIASGYMCFNLLPGGPRGCSPYCYYIHSYIIVQAPHLRKVIASCSFCSLKTLNSYDYFR